MIYATVEAANAAIASKLNEQGFISLDDIKTIIRGISCDIANAGPNTN